MKARGSLSVLFTFCIFFAIASPSEAASAGGRCTRVGTTARQGRVTLQCAKVGKTLKWVRKPTTSGSTQGSPQIAAGDTCSSDGVTVTSGSLTLECRRVASNNYKYFEVSTVFSPLSNPASPEPIDVCRLPDQRTVRAVQGPQAIAYPAVASSVVTNRGTVNIAVILVDFADVVGDQSEIADHVAQVKKAAEWMTWYSQGNVKYSLQITERWIRAPRPSGDYFWLHPGKAGTQVQSDQEIASAYQGFARSVVDMSNITVIWVVHPKKVTAIDEGFAWRGSPSVFSIGSDTYKGGWPIWQHFLHETLHSHGALGHSPKNSFFGLFNFTGSPGATLNSWDAITLDWMRIENLYCVSRDRLARVELNLVPLEREQAGLRAAVVKLSNSEALIIESHRRDKWSDRWPAGTYGVTVMRVDTRVDTVHDLGSSTGRYLMGDRRNSLMVEGESLETDGVRISLIRSGNQDVVRLEPIG